MKASLFCIVFCLALAFVSARTVTGQIRNEFQDVLTLKTSLLQSGTWVKQPAQSVAVGTTYGTLFIAGGAEVSGSLLYTSEGGYASVKISFVNTPTNSSYTNQVGPSPFIGGVGSVTGSGDSVVPYWVHEMCISKNQKNECLQ